MTISFEEFKDAHSNYSSVGALREETWAPILDILNNEGWTPYEYLDFVFRQYRKPMVPDLLKSPEVVESYREEHRARVLENQRRAAWALDQIQSRLRNKHKIEDILSDKEINNNALLMYLIAATDKNEEAMKRFREPAIYECRTAPELIDFYSVPFSRRLFPDDK